jgi:ADP-heptose:LPS heptosyltransferase
VLLSQIQNSEIYNLTRHATKILVVDLGFLGDTLHLVPVLWELRRHYPDAQIHVLSGPLGCEVLTLAPCINRTWKIELHPSKRSTRDTLTSLRQVRSQDYEIAFNFGGGDRALILTALSGAKLKIVAQGARKHFWDKLLIQKWIPRQPLELPVYEQRRRVLPECGMRLSAPKFDLRVPESATKMVEQFPTPAIHVSINSANPLKEWPIRHYSELLNRLLNEVPELHIIVSVGAASREQERLQSLMGAVKNSRLLPVTKPLPLAQLAALLRRCIFHFGPDSGVMHLAQALAVPSLSLFRNQPGSTAWLPDQPGQEPLIADCSCIDHKSCPCESRGEAACLVAITPEKVFAHLKPHLLKLL